MYLITDLETSVKNVGEGAIGTNKANVHHPDNRIVMYGFKMEGKPEVTGHYKESHVKGMTIPPEKWKNVDILVGHNVKFDIQYLWKFHPELKPWFNTGKIWDTQLAEYILSGQTHLYPKLDDCSVKYGGTLKDDRIKDYWNSGVDTEDIPEHELKEYLEWDLKNTETVFLHQVAKAEELGMIDLIWFQMDALLCTTEMEWNGMYFNRETAEVLSDKVGRQRDALLDKLTIVMEAAGIRDVNPLSNDHVSLFFFGGEQKYRARVPIMDEVTGMQKVYGPTAMKAGQGKFRIEDRVESIKGFLVPKKEYEAKKPGFYKVNDEVMNDIKGDSELALDFLKLRQLNKDINTYYKGYSDLVWPNGLIHGSLNHCATATGRLSSTKPNMQNISSYEEE